MTTPVKFLLATPITKAAQVSADGLYEKDFIADGKWWVPALGTYLPVNAERRAKWERNFQLMRERGVTVPLSIDHIETRDPDTGEIAEEAIAPGKARSVYGEVHALFNRGNRGMFTAKPADEEGAKLMQRCPEVSLELERNWRDGHGNLYDEAITGITLTPKPVYAGQLRQWTKVAASRSGGGAGGGKTTRRGERVYLANLLRDDGNILPHEEPNEEPSMFNAETRKALCIKLGLAVDVADAVLSKKIADTIETPPPESETKTKLSRAETEVATLKTKVTELENQIAGSQPVKLGRDVEAVLQEGIDGKVELLVDRACISPAVGKLLATELKSGGAIMLSRESNGGEKSRGAKILEILAQNDAVEIAKRLGEKTPGQRTSLSRETPEDGDGEKTQEQRIEAGLKHWGLDKNKK